MVTVRREYGGEAEQAVVVRGQVDARVGVVAGAAGAALALRLAPAARLHRRLAARRALSGRTHAHHQGGLRKLISIFPEEYC